MNEENIATALDAFRADSEALKTGISRIDLRNGRFATVERKAGFDYVRLYDLRGEPLTAKRFRVA